MKEKLFRTTLIKAAKRKREKISFGHGGKNHSVLFLDAAKIFYKGDKKWTVSCVSRNDVSTISQGGHARTYVVTLLSKHSLHLI